MRFGITQARGEGLSFQTIPEKMCLNGRFAPLLLSPECLQRSLWGCSYYDLFFSPQTFPKEQPKTKRVEPHGQARGTT